MYILKLKARGERSPKQLGLGNSLLVILSGLQLAQVEVVKGVDRFLVVMSIVNYSVRLRSHCKIHLMSSWSWLREIDVQIGW